jgi:uncharacterized membrane-anchored protein YhcB (DUF1043 family)
MTIERRKKTFWENPITIACITAIILALIMIPINFFTTKFNNALSTPEQLENFKTEIRNNNEKIVIEFNNKFDILSKDIKELKDYKKDNEQNTLRFEKAITRLETLIERLKVSENR